MRSDSVAVVALARGSRRTGSAADAWSGPELVEVSERFYRSIFFGVLAFVGIAASAAGLLLPLRAGRGGPSMVAVAADASLLAASLVGLRHVKWLYLTLRRWPRAELIPVAYSAALVTAVFPLHSQLWWPSCALLMLLGVVAPLRRVLVYCLAVLAANLGAHVLDGDIGNTPPVTIIGLWVGYVFWTAAVAAFTDQLASHLLRRQVSRPSRSSSLRVTAWVNTEPEDAGQASPQDIGDGRVHDGHDDPDRQPAAEPADVERSGPASGPGEPMGRQSATGKLTARQLQVVALLADGLAYRDVAACLSISPGQVQRHVAQSVARLGVNNANELVAVAVADRLVPDRRGEQHDDGAGHPADCR